MKSIKCVALGIVVMMLMMGVAATAGAELFTVEEGVWTEIKGKHFLVYHQDDEKFGNEVLRSAEKHYKNIAADLGLRNAGKLWTWDKRVKLYIFPDKAGYHATTGEPEWSEGVASYFDKTIVSYAWSEGFTDALLPHELTHLVFRDFVGFTSEIPIWLDEGVAQWMEPKKRAMASQVIRQMAEKYQLISMRRLMNPDPRILEGEKAEWVNRYYVHAMSLIDFLIKKYGADNFTRFCRQLRDGKSVDDALRFAYSSRNIKSVEELEVKWKEEIWKAP